MLIQFFSSFLAALLLFATGNAAGEEHDTSTIPSATVINQLGAGKYADRQIASAEIRRRISRFTNYEECEKLRTRLAAIASGTTDAEIRTRLDTFIKLLKTDPAVADAHYKALTAKLLRLALRNIARLLATQPYLRPPIEEAKWRDFTQELQNYKSLVGRVNLSPDLKAAEELLVVHPRLEAKFESAILTPLAKTKAEKHTEYASRTPFPKMNFPERTEYRWGKNSMDFFPYGSFTAKYRLSIPLISADELRNLIEEPSTDSNQCQWLEKKKLFLKLLEPASIELVQHVNFTNDLPPVFTATLEIASDSKILADFEKTEHMNLARVGRYFDSLHIPGTFDAAMALRESDWENPEFGEFGQQEKIPKRKPEPKFPNRSF